jgi:hypothetical protein
MPVQKSDRHTAPGFRDTLIGVSRSLGPHHLPLDHKASDINSFLGADSTHHSLVKRAVMAIYRANRCSHLDSLIDTTRTFDALGKLYGELNGDPDTDVDQVDLLEKLGQELSLLLPPVHTDSIHRAESKEDRENPSRNGGVISLSRIRKTRQ